LSIVKDAEAVAPAVAPSADPAQAAAAAPRAAYVDNLRWSMILLVIGMHAADTYSPFGNWYYADKAATGRLTAMAFGTYQSFLQAFFMGLLFAIAGYFARASLIRKGAVRFVRDRAIRLGLPVLLYMFAVGPVTEFFVAHSWRPKPGTPFAADWWHHIADREVWSESGPLWFCLALLLFCFVYAALPRSGGAARSEARSEPARPLRFGAVMAFIGLMATATFALRLWLPEGRSVLNLPVGDFAQYVLMFAAGVGAHRSGWIERLPAGRGGVWLALGFGLGAVGWAALIVFGGGLQGHFDGYSGGWRWAAAGKSLWAAFVGVTVSLGLIRLYRDRLNTTNSLFAFLSANAFAVYVFHPPILIAVTRLLSAWSGPPALKLLAAWGLGAAGSFLFADLIARRIPGLREIL
jgi:hypothetical protein